MPIDLSRVIGNCSRTCFLMFCLSSFAENPKLQPATTFWRKKYNLDSHDATKKRRPTFFAKG